MYQAQAQLADAYIAAGQAAEARFIAEDLVAREPWEKANIERFRRALVLMGEPDPDGLIASRLSGESPFLSTDLTSGESLFDDLPAVPAPAASAAAGPAAEADIEELLAQAEQVEDPSTARHTAKPQASKPKSKQFQLSANAIDLDSILGDLESLDPDPEPAARPKAHAATDDVEVDLSIVIDDIKKPPRGGGPAKDEPPADLDGVFGNLREQASKRSGLDDEEKEYKRALALRSSGDVEGCIQALERASRAPKLRFGASWLIARLYRERDMLPQALEWLERGAQAPAPNADESYQLLYELADLLEQTGEIARALAICIELQADAGEYKDVSARIDRLTKVQAGG